MKDEKDLNEELEDIAEIFREELKKAQNASEEELFENGAVIQQMDDEHTEEEIPEEELCACCGENPRDKSYGENYEYCSDCRETMRRYPLSIPSIIVFAAMVIIAIFSVKSFAQDFSLYNTVRQGDAYLSEDRLELALDSYDGAISGFEDADITAKRLYLKTAEILTDTMPNGIYSMSEIASRVETALSSFESKLPVYSKYTDMHEDALVLYGTMQKFYEIMNSEEYAYYTGEDDTVYNAMMAEVENIIGSEITVKTVGGEKVQTAASEPMVYFCQYMLAYSMGKTADASVYLQRVSEAGGEYVWLYAYELGITKLQHGNVDRALELAELLYETNTDSADPYALYSSVYRMTGDTENSALWLQKGIEIKPENAELYRLLAMTCIVEGDTKGALEAIENAMNYDEYGLLYMVAMVVENEAGNAQAVAQYKTALETSGVSVSERVESYFNGEITAVQLFTEGTGDVE